MSISGEIKTKWGTAQLNKGGYYVITSSKEGNNMKYLHRLIYEEEYGEIPQDCIIHHIDKNKTNNSIENLELMSNSNHTSLHMKGKNHPMFGKIGENNPNFGRKHSINTIKKMSGENNHMYGKNHSIESKLKISESKNNSGYFRVFKSKDSRYKQGFIWCYRWLENGKQQNIYRVNLEDLENEVKNRNLKWFKLSKGEESDDICVKHI